MKYRNVSGEPRFVAHLQTTVEPDEVVTDVDDGTFRVWPESLWEGIGKPPALPDGIKPYPDPDAPASAVDEPTDAAPATTTKAKG